MVYHGYTVDSKFVSGSSIAWKGTGTDGVGNGAFIFGTKGGKKYFIKRNINTKFPSEDLPKALYANEKEIALRVENKQKAIKHNFKEAGITIKDHVVVEVDHFWDEDSRQFVTVTECVDGIEDSHRSYKKEPEETLRLLFISMAGALGAMHKAKVIHSDLKEGNFLIKKVGDRYEAYVCDFDGSYPEGYPETDFSRLAFTEGYQSPEIAYTTVYEEESPDFKFTTKTDVFTLAIIFHLLMAGIPPYVGCETTFNPGEALLDNYPLSFSNKKANKPILEGKSKYNSLFNWMMQPKPENRPSCEDVVKVLKGELFVPIEFCVGDDKNAYDTLWEGHKGFAIYSVEKLRANHIVSFTRFNDKDNGLCYLVALEGEMEESVLTIQNILEKGYLESKEVIICDPWPEDGIEWINDAFVENDIASVSQRMILGKRMYTLKKFSGIAFNHSAKAMVELGFARPISKTETPTNGDDFELWPEHDVVFASQEFFAERSIVAIKKLELDGEKGYLVKYSNGKADKELSLNTLINLEYVKRVRR